MLIDIAPAWALDRGVSESSGGERGVVGEREERREGVYFILLFQRRGVR
jgi:hypothetical protein